MFKLIKNSGSSFTILLIGIIVVWVSSNYNWGDNRWQGILKADATGYYAYLPAVFIYKDLEFNYLDTIIGNESYSDNLNFDFREDHKHTHINKFFCGTAVLQSPFFLLGHITTKITNKKADGYSAFYPIFIQIATIFYLLLGLAFLSALLKSYEIKEWMISITLIAIVFGTNLFHYTVSEPGMSHVYSFCFVSMFLYLQKLYFERLSIKHWLLSIIALALIVLIRPINLIIVLAIPFIALSGFQLRKGISELFINLKYLILSAIIFVSIVGIQLIIYKVGTGDFLVYAYKEEGFNFLDPNFPNFLFSYRKGLFVYTPLLLLIILFGLPQLFYKNPYEALCWFGFIVLIVYILSSWHLWYYGGSFSARVMIEYLPLFAILLAKTLSYQENSKKLQKIFISLLLIMALFSQIQTYQYRTGRIHWSDMNKEKYWESITRIPKSFKID